MRRWLVPGEMPAWWFYTTAVLASLTVFGLTYATLLVNERVTA